MKDYEDTFSVERMADVLGVSRSGYYDFVDRPPSLRFLTNEKLISRIKAIFAASDNTYGSPRIHAALIDEGYRCSRPKVARLMKAHGIQAKMYKKFKKTTIPSKIPYYKAEDHVQQNFHTSAPNTVWVADITYILINKSWAYLAVILDLFSRKVVGMALQDHMKTALILEALNQALNHEKTASRPYSSFRFGWTIYQLPITADGQCTQYYSQSR